MCLMLNLKPPLCPHCRPAAAGPGAVRRPPPPPPRAARAGAVCGGLAAPRPGTPEPAAIDQGSLLLLAVADGVVAFLLGYRLAAPRAPAPLEAARAAGPL